MPKSVAQVEPAEDTSQPLATEPQLEPAPRAKTPAFPMRRAGALPPPDGTPSAMRAARVIGIPSPTTGLAMRASMMNGLQAATGNARAGRLAIQAKLAVNRPDDAFEREADHVASTVMRMSAADAVDSMRHTEPESSRASQPSIMRFVGTEHAELGDTTGATIDLGDGVVLTWGQVVAIAGDEYGSVEDLAKAAKTPAGKRRLRAALQHDGVPGTVAASLPSPSATEIGEQGQEFIRLAMENSAHFPDEGAAMSAWVEHHVQALGAALVAGLTNRPAAINRAYLLEAFGQHFLTDAFSGGHIRTPRSQIIEWYTTVFAPRIVGPLFENLQTRMIDALVEEANPQTNWPRAAIRHKIAPRVRGPIAALIASHGGMTAITRMVGLGIAGAVSGALHDSEGATGVLVASDDHPAPWRAYGDNKLRDSPESKDQATKAIAAAKGAVDRAYQIGEEEGFTKTISEEPPPAVIHFRFNSSALEGPALRATETAAAHLLYHPSSAVQLIGHTDSIGTDEYNEGLGMRRAQAVEATLVAAGVPPAQVSVRSDGERRPLTRDPRNFRINRRAEFAWTSRAASPGPLTNPEELARARATMRVLREAGPPFTQVTRYVPRPVEERGGTGNAPLPDWHWGRLPASLRLEVDAWIRREVGARLRAEVATNPALAAVTESGVTVHPRDAADAIVTELLLNPTARVGDLAGEAPGP